MSRKFKTISDAELKLRLAESFDLLLNSKSQQPIVSPASSKESVSLPQAPTSKTKKGA